MHRARDALHRVASWRYCSGRPVVHSVTRTCLSVCLSFSFSLPSLARLPLNCPKLLASFVFPSYAAWLAHSPPFHVISTCPRDAPLPHTRLSLFLRLLAHPSPILLAGECSAIPATMDLFLAVFLLEDDARRVQYSPSHRSCFSPFL